MTVLQESLARDPSGYELRKDPTVLAPERLLVFEVRGSIQNFVNAARKTRGLEYVGEEELPEDEDEKPVIYLMVPDATAFRQILSLWERWKNKKPFDRGLTPWRDLFNCLRDLRPWGPQDRVSEPECNILLEEIEGLADDELVRLEIELVYLSNENAAGAKEKEVRNRIQEEGGRIVHRVRIPEIAYHALLVELPVRSVRAIADRQMEGIAGFDPVRHIRPQSIATRLEITEPGESIPSPEAELRDEPILALLDGVPVSQHSLLKGRLNVVDEFGLEENTLVERRVHGTAMASLILYGDRNRAEEPPLTRKVHVIPVIGGDGIEEAFPKDRLVIDVIYQAVRTIRERGDAPEVIIINLSLGNKRLRFYGIPSPWARLLDRLAWYYGLLFVVSAGNIKDQFEIDRYSSRTEFEDAEEQKRSESVIAALDAVKADRRLLAPAESMNAITVGAANISWTPRRERFLTRSVIDPHPDITISNPSSALGPGIAKSVKPDILFAGGKEHLRPLSSGEALRVESTPGLRQTGLKVAAPSRDGISDAEGYTGGTSAAAALASRTCHRIHDALEEAYGEDFLRLSHHERAALLKALIAHPVQWPLETAERIANVVDPDKKKYHAHRKDDIRRFLGYGIVDGDEAVACTVDRATFWAAGMITRNTTIDVRIPIPVCVGRGTQALHFSATLAWLTPTRPGQQSYKAVKLDLKCSMDVLRVDNVSRQPDANQSKRGTLITRRWESKHAQTVGSDDWETVFITRMSDQGEPVDEAVPFGLAVTLAVPGTPILYEEARSMIELRAGARVRP